jgi:hypothetical protein
MARYFDDPCEFVLDTRNELRVNVEYVILENRERFPEPYSSSPPRVAPLRALSLAFLVLDARDRTREC